MDAFFNNAVKSALHHYENASASDFGALALAIVLVGWFCTRFYGDR